MFKYIHILLLLLSVDFYAQEISVSVVSETPLEATTFYAVDDYGSVYYSKENTLFKKGDSGNYQFTALPLGNISSLDILNPLRITVFYESSNTALILDNTLSEIARINFSTIQDFRNVSHATTASDRRLWIFNTDLQQLEIFDWNSGKIITQFPPMEDNASSIVSNFNFCWVQTDTSLFKYNNYGSFINQVSLRTDYSVKQANGDLIAGTMVEETSFTKAELYYKPRSSSEFTLLKIPDLSVKQFSLNNEILYIYDGKKVTSLSLKPPKK